MEKCVDFRSIMVKKNNNSLFKGKEASREKIEKKNEARVFKTIKFGRFFFFLNTFKSFCMYLK